MTVSQDLVFLCNGASLPSDLGTPNMRCESLQYDPSCPGRNITLGLPKFIRLLQHVPDRVLDLLELASYIYCADRSTSRGAKNAVVYTGWTRNITIIMKVRDWAFWLDVSIMETLADMLGFMSGHSFSFMFQPGHTTSPTSLFDRSDIDHGPIEDCRIALFSGGLDSLSGIITLLETESRPLYLVSHRSQNGTFGTQTALFKALTQLYPARRIYHVPFSCNLHGSRAEEETQRTRFFLYASVAYATSVSLGVQGFSVYENGVTSLNLAKSQPLMNARSSRTTHPRTLAGVVSLFSRIGSQSYELHNPFAWMTKAEVIDRIISYDRGDLISSSVSCSRTFDDGVKDQRTHCGRCSQCIDRRMGMYVTDGREYDNEALYVRNLISDDLDSGEAKTTLVDYIRQAIDFESKGEDGFYDNYLDELTDILPYLAFDEHVAVKHVYDLCRRHGKGVIAAVKNMQTLHDDLTKPISSNSLLGVVADREYLKEPIRRASR